MKQIAGNQLWASLRYAFYVAVRPLDGFWDLIHEKRGSLGAAHIIVVAAIVVEILTVTLTNIQFSNWGLYMEYFNVSMVVLQVLVPLLLWTLSNWSLTTLMDGKGRFHEIYMATAYALTPSIIIKAVLILLSHLITRQEGTVYQVLAAFSLLWSGMLIMAAMMMIHDYSPAKMLFSSFLSIVGMGVIVFIFLIFFNMISDMIAYLISIVKEIRFRMG
ncbi:MAG: YIP1 family protein [Treponema sp.]|jgi:hypothetical protein|nr:YIP1 family protein [Treponema sp.]